MGGGCLTALAGWTGPPPPGGLHGLGTCPCSFRARSSGPKGMSSITGRTSHPETHKSSSPVIPSHLQFQPGPAVAAGCSRSAGAAPAGAGSPSFSPGSGEQMAGHSGAAPSQAHIPHPTLLLGDTEAAHPPRPHQLPLLGATGQGFWPHAPPGHPQTRPVSHMQARAPSGFRAAGRRLGRAGSFPAIIPSPVICPGLEGGLARPPAGRM